MDMQMGLPKLLKMGAKLVGHKLQQYQLATSNTVVVKTNYGHVKGLQRRTIYDKELYYAFESIPYAKPPRGDLRFRAPQPPEPWQGIKDCTSCHSKPLQRNVVLGMIEGSENCLHLNVYTKDLQSDTPLPVIVWIYGGAFQNGEASRDFYSPDYFMQQQVILVTINYRLGALGFLSLKDPALDVPGNAGLKDQVQALRWISENIAHFNGDPTNITLMGESAGAACTHIMMSTEQTRGLFHKAIMQSGCALSNWAMAADSNWAYRLAAYLGYDGSEADADVLQFLMTVPARKIAASDRDIVTLDEFRNFLLYAFGPVVEPYESSHCVVPKPLKQMLSHAWGNSIPLIVGGTSFEGLFSYQIARNDPWILCNFKNIIPRDVRENSTPEHVDQLVRRLKHLYFGDEQRQTMDLFETLNIFSHKQIWHDLHRIVRARQSYAADAPTYLYRFDFDSPHFNQFRRLVCGSRVRGVSHGDDLSYMFYNIVASKQSKSSLEYRTIERMMGMWTAFAATGNPNCAAITPSEWLPVQLDPKASYKCFNISDQLEMIELPEAKTLEVWDTFYPRDDLY